MSPERQPGFLAPFRTRGFRFLWSADLLIASAIEMEILILGWYVLTTTGSVLLLTLLGSVQYVGALVAPVAGMVGDRVGLRRLLVTMRALYVLLALLLTVLAATGNLTPIVAIVIAGCASLARSSDAGMRSALCAEIVPADRLLRALGIARTTADAARATGALAGAGLFALLGLVPAYAIVTGCHLAGCLLTLGARADRERPSMGAGIMARGSPWRELGDGLAYVWKTPHLAGGMWLACLVNMTAFPLTSGLMPYVAREVYHLDQNGLGLLVASFSVGALSGAFLTGVLGGRLMAGRTALIAAMVWHLAVMVFPWAPGPQAAMGVLLVAGVAQGFCLVPLSSFLLRTSEPAMRGRVMGVRMLAIYSLPFGLLGAGWLIERVGFRTTVMAYGAVGLLLALAIALRWRRSLFSVDSPANRG